MRAALLALWVAAAAAALAGCAGDEDRGPALDPARFHFPSGIALTEEEGAFPQRLLVVSSNTDLRFRSGRVHAFDRETIDRLVDEATAGCPDPSCPPVDVRDLSPALVGSVEIGDLAGQIAVSPLDGPGLPPARAFVPVRGRDAVVALDLDAAGIRCAAPGDECLEGGAAFSRPDPFVIEAALGQIYVGHGALGRQSTGIIGMAQADAPFWSRGGGSLLPLDVGNTAVGGLASGACRIDGGGAEVCTVFANGRARIEGIQRILAFDIRRGALMAGPLFSRNLAPQQDGFDSRGIGIGTEGTRAYLANRFPDALAVVDVSRLPDLPSDTCLLPPGVELGEGAACPYLPPNQGDRPRFATMDLSPSPEGPLVVRVIPRALPAGGTSDLIAMTTRRSIAFFDGPSGALVGNLEGVGGGPSDLVARPRGTGLRLYVPSFERGTVAVVDLDDPFRPGEARLVARLGPPRED